MKCKKLMFYFLSVYFIGITFIVAQNSVNASGGNLSGANGSVSYSVGQMVYTTNSGTNGSNAQGVQQPYEISEVLSSIDYSELISDLKIYPNPSTDHIKINFINLNNLNLSLKIIDINGKVIKKEDYLQNETTIDVSSYSSNIYFLNIMNKDKLIKSFKLIKK
ncbi:T9SS type A sorting domain-containing protein [Flavobacterium cyclinae]|uniref:T9SS type A sorting domain-containing protein n=1 Tax=Flavobacterium cyclinae TaxID=2895947 RepID=UPI001E3AF7C2|nr:T9SS type A sorting domain-containing protein [Flavobacterium cyclinae]UGS22192.1 T9SS type A sorting domain-containing protein [Flavobacterium cyclinae]